MNALKCTEPLRGNYYNAHACFLQENGQPYVWPYNGGRLDFYNGAVPEKTPQIFGPLFPVEYVTEFSG